MKKLSFVAATAAAGMVLFGGMASAQDTPENDDYYGVGGSNGQVGLLNLNNTDVLHNVSAAVGVCDNNVNVLGVQVPVDNVANGLGIPLLSPGEHSAEAETPQSCATNGLFDGGSSQNN